MIDLQEDNIELSLEDTIKTILLQKIGKAYSPHEILTILGSHRSIDEITDSLEKIKNNNFIKKSKRKNSLDFEYSIFLTNPIKSFLTAIAKETKDMLKREDFDNVYERDELIKLNAFTHEQLKALYPTRSANSNTIRQYVYSLSNLGILNNNGSEAYYIDYSYLESLGSLEEVIELNRFWNSALNYKNIESIEFHGLLLKSHKKLKVEYDNLLASNGWKEKSNRKVLRKAISLGTITIQVLSNDEDQSIHNIEISYKGSLIQINSQKRKERGKFAIRQNKLSELFSIIKEILYQLNYNKEIEFDHTDFNNFLIFSIGINIDVEEERTLKLIRKVFPDFQFDRNLSVKFAENDYQMRFYKYYDKFTEKMMGRFDNHIYKPNVFNVTSMLDVLSNTGESLINKQIVLHKLENSMRLIKEYQHNLIRDQTKFHDLLQDYTTKVTAELRKSHKHIEDRDKLIFKELKELSNNAKSNNKSIKNIEDNYNSFSNNIQNLEESVEIISTNTTSLISSIAKLDTEFPSVIDDIEKVKTQLTQSITNISKSFQQNADIFKELKEENENLRDLLNVESEEKDSLKQNMLLLSDLANQNSESGKNTSNAINKLTILVDNLYKEPTKKKKFWKR